MQIGGSLLTEKVEDEVKYYQQPEEGTTLSIFPEGTEWVTWPYGGQYIVGKDSGRLDSVARRFSQFRIRVGQ